MQSKKWIRSVIVHLTLIFLSFLCLFFFYVLIINATKTQVELLRPFSPIPGRHGPDNLDKVLKDPNIPVLYGILNSMIVSGFSAILSVYFSVMTAYGLYVYNFRMRNAYFTFIMMILVMPTQVCTLGFLRVISGIGLDDNLLALILPTVASPAVFYFMYSYMKSTLNTSLIDSARMDGAGEYRIYSRIVLPLMRPAMSVQGIFAFLSSWNNYFVPSLVINTRRRQTMPIMMATMRATDFVNKDMGKAYMMIAFAIVPVIIVYSLLSRQIIDGVIQGSGYQEQI